MDYEIGPEIRKKIEEKGMSFVSFADKFGITDRNLQYLFKKSDLSLQQIIRASEILDYDFLFDYLKTKKPKYKVKSSHQETTENKSAVKNENLITMSLQLSGDIKNYSENFPDFLKLLSIEAVKYGFKLQ